MYIFVPISTWLSLCSNETIPNRPLCLCVRDDMCMCLYCIPRRGDGNAGRCGTNYTATSPLQVNDGFKLVSPRLPKMASLDGVPTTLPVIMSRICRALHCAVNHQRLPSSVTHLDALSMQAHR